MTNYTKDFTNEHFAENIDDIIDIANKKVKTDICIVVLDNTNGLSSDLFSRLSQNKNDNIKVRIKGGLDEKKKRKYNTQSYYDRTIYSPKELFGIVKEFEKIEDKINPKWSERTKAVYIYTTLAKSIEYEQSEDMRLDSNGRDKVRTLNSVVSKKAVCAGYALILKEMMERNGIKCEYINKPHSHAWNALTIDNKDYLVDLTWDACYAHKAGAIPLNYLGIDKDFSKNKSHQPDESEPKINPSLFSVDEVVSSYKEIQEKNPATQEKTKEFFYVNSDNGVRYGLVELGKSKGKDNEFGYLICKKNQDGNPDDLEIFTLEKSLRDAYSTGTEQEKANKLVNEVFLKRKVQKFQEIYKNPVGQSRNLMSYKRKDGTSFIILSSATKKYPEVNEYTFIEPVLVNKKIVLETKTIYSENNLLHPKDENEKSDIANLLLTQKRVQEKTSKVGGYVGFIQNRGKIYNSALEKKIGNFTRNTK